MVDPRQGQQQSDSPPRVQPVVPNGVDYISQLSFRILRVRQELRECTDVEQNQLRLFADDDVGKPAAAFSDQVGLLMEYEVCIPANTQRRKINVVGTGIDGWTPPVIRTLQQERVRPIMEIGRMSTTYVAGREASNMDQA